jgi:hypothetical protein
MSSKPILFSGEMVSAILEGRKTQTRRLIKMADGSLCDDSDIPANDGFRANYVMDYSKTFPQWKQLDCPKGKPGDQLWVREKWNAQTQSGKWWHEVKRADRPLLNWAWTNPIRPAFEAIPPRWLPSIHMPRAASRITLEIVNVRVERLQSISDSDAEQEGVHLLGLPEAERNYPRKRIVAYEAIWDLINREEGKRWKDNPWVWVIEFKVVE